MQTFSRTRLRIKWHFGGNRFDNFWVTAVFAGKSRSKYLFSFWISKTSDPIELKFDRELFLIQLEDEGSSCFNRFIGFKVMIIFRVEAGQNASVGLVSRKLAHRLRRNFVQRFSSSHLGMRSHFGCDKFFGFQVMTFFRVNSVKMPLLAWDIENCRTARAGILSRRPAYFIFG